jgi:hypothetical protein
LLSEGVLARVGDVEEAVFVLRHPSVSMTQPKQVATLAYLMFLVYRAHERGSGREHLIDEDEDGLLGGELDALADHIDELADGEIGGDEVLLLVDCRDVRLFNLLADNLSRSQNTLLWYGKNV